MKKAKEQKMDTLEQIKRLLVLALFRQGVQGKDIAETLGVVQLSLVECCQYERVSKDNLIWADQLS